MKHKYFTKRYGTDAVAKLVELRKDFPEHHFVAGIHKGERGIFCLGDRDNREYGEKVELDNGDFFFPPTDANLKLVRDNLNSYKTKWEERLKVTLLSGVDLFIFPASALPKKVYFTQKKKNNTSTYDDTTEYGKAAYLIYDRTQREESMKLDDPQIVEFIMMGLSYSYKLPKDYWDCLGIISLGDFDKLFAAMLGADWDMLQEEVKKSNAASQQTTGVNAA